jgi:DNA polymerase I-like protein with 3'-5' exonuclease and polymerase domains
LHNGLLQFDEARPIIDAPPDLTGVDTVTIDTETTGLDWVRGDRPVGIAVGYGDRRMYLPFAHRGGGNLDEGQVKRWALRELRGKRIHFFNAKFDIHQMRLWGVDLREQGNTFHDVSFDGCLLDDHRPKNRLRLEHFAQDYLQEGKDDIGRPEHIADLPGNVVAAYAARDVDLTMRLQQVFDPLIAAEDLGRVSALEDACIPATVEIESHGYPLDVERCRAWHDELQAIANRILRDLHQLCGFACTPSKKPDMARLFQRAGVTYGRTPTGQAEFPADVVLEAAKTSREVLLAYRWQKVQHLMSKGTAAFLKHEHRGVLYPSFHQMLGEDGGTISGRYSSSRPNGQNLLNKTKYSRAYGWLAEYTDTVFLLRDLIVPERHVWVNGDQKQVEYRIAAHYMNDPEVLQWYRDNPKTDFHEKVMHMIQRVRPGITREESKAPGFARMYGGGPGVVSTNIGISYEDAVELVDTYDAAFPGIGRLFRRAEQAANDRGYVRTFLGRRCRFKGQRGHRERTHKALNHVCQGTGADNAKQALVAVYAERKRLGLTMRVTEHDAIGGDLEGPLQPLKDLLNEQRMPLRVPITWDVATGATWAKAKG